MCSRCGGSGWIFSFSHVEDGRCFKCNPQGLRVVANHTPAPLQVAEPATGYMVAWGSKGTSFSSMEKETFEFEDQAWMQVAIVLSNNDPHTTKVSVFAPDGARLETGKTTWTH